MAHPYGANRGEPGRAARGEPVSRRLDIASGVAAVVVLVFWFLALLNYLASLPC